MNNNHLYNEEILKQKKALIISKITELKNQLLQDTEELVNQMNAFEKIEDSKEKGGTVHNIVLQYHYLLADLKAHEWLEKNFFATCEKESCKHILVDRGDSLFCIKCEQSFPVDNVYICRTDFVQKMLLHNASTGDIPFLQNIAQENEDADISFFRKKLSIAHHLELDFHNALFSLNEYEQIHQKLVEQFKEQVDISSFYSDFCIQEFLVADFEAMILGSSVAAIPFMLRRIKRNYSGDSSIREQLAFSLIKAYNNLSHEEYRLNSQWFKSAEEAKEYECLLADPEINEMILDYKLRRK